MNEDPQEPTIDWRLTTWEGSRREQLRRWAQLPLEVALQAVEEMHELAEELRAPGSPMRVSQNENPESQPP